MKEIAYFGVFEKSNSSVFLSLFGKYSLKGNCNSPEDPEPFYGSNGTGADRPYEKSRHAANQAGCHRLDNGNGRPP